MAYMNWPEGPPFARCSSKEENGLPGSHNIYFLYSHCVRFQSVKGPLVKLLYSGSVDIIIKEGLRCFAWSKERPKRVGA